MIWAQNPNFTVIILTERAFNLSSSSQSHFIIGFFDIDLTIIFVPLMLVAPGLLNISIK